MTVFFPLDLIYPLEEHEVTSHFGIRKSGYHWGTDFRATIGTDVMASADGDVIWTGYNEGSGRGSYGNAVFVLHEDGYITGYAHLRDYNVEFGRHVRQGEVIGHSGNTGGSRGPHLHFEVIDGNKIRSDGKTIKETIYVFGKMKLKNGESRHVGVHNYEGRIDPIKCELRDGRKISNSNNKNSDKNGSSNSSQGAYCANYTRETFPSDFYIWHTRKDDKVRPSHAELDGTVRSTEDELFPGEDYNCRCWAEPITFREAIERIYVDTLLSATRGESLSDVLILGN